MTTTTVSNTGGGKVSKYEKTRVPAMRRTLAFLLTCLQGNEVVVELKNDSEVRGVVEESDKMMNIHLSTVVETKPDGTYRELESYRVSGFSVRYVHLPRFIKTHSLVSDHARRLDRITKSSRPHTIKDRAKSQVSLREPREEIILEPMDYDGEK